MPDNIANLVVGTATDPIQGNLAVDYTTASVGGSLGLVVNGISVPVLNLALTNSGGNAYQITGTTAAGTGVTLGFVGQTPTIISTSVSALGLPVVTGSESVTVSIACYGSGTRIRTINGDIAVEHLAIGDLVVTSSGVAKPIKWIGHRFLSCRASLGTDGLRPIRIARDAFGPNQPSRDLFVSPGHAICVDLLGEVLIPASSLVNGRSVEQVAVDTVTYWHVELEDHDIILAENLPAESYLDCDNRSFFAEGAVVSLAMRADWHPTTDDYCRPFVVDGPLVDAVRARLAERAGLTEARTLAA